MPAANVITPLAIQVSPLVHIPLSFQALQSSPLVSLTVWMTCSNLVYAARRSHIRKMKKRELLKIRLTKEKGMSMPAHLLMILAWQAFVFTFPFVEPIARLFGFVSFIYYYPNANGCGIILEPLSVQNMKMRQRAKHQIRFDWHDISINIGDMGRDGYRHPPSIKLNVPHIDIPNRSIKHWPWRRKPMPP